MNATPTPIATPTKLKIIIQTKSGKSWQARVERVVWTDGRVSLCATASLDRPATQAPRPYGHVNVVYSSRPGVSARMREPAEGERIVHRSTSEYEVGQILHATRVAGGGGPDGHYWTVLAASSHRIAEWENDCREGETEYDALVRPATDEEATARAAQIAEATAAQVAREDTVRQLTTGEPQGRDAYPAGRVIASQPPRCLGSMAATPYLIATETGAVYHVRPIYDDAPLVTLLPLTVEDALAAARVAAWKVTP